MEGTSEGTGGQGTPAKRVKEKKQLVSEDELDQSGKEVDRWFEHKDDPEMLKRITDNIEKLRGWTVSRGAKKEPELPLNVEKIAETVSLRDENLYYRYAEDAPDPYMLWAIDTDNDPAAAEEAPDGLMLRVIRDNEISITMMDVRYPKEGKADPEIGTTVMRSKFATGAERQTVNFPPRKLSRLSGAELGNADIFFRLAVESVIFQPRRPQGNAPTFRRIDSKT